MREIVRKRAIAVVAVLAGAIATGCGGGSHGSGNSSGAGSGGGGSSGGGSSSTITTAVSAPCGLAQNVPVALAIGARSNSPMPVLTTAVTGALNSAVNANKPITLIRLDGNPKVVFRQAFVSGPNTQITKQHRNEYVASLNGVLAGTGQPATDIRAQVPQADVLGALAEAASAVPAGGDVIVMDSGLQTMEPLDFRTGLLSDDASSIVDYLKHSGELPDLRGRHIYFVGLGWTASPQPNLSISDRRKLAQIWVQITEAAGGCVGLDQAANTNNAVPGRPPVGIVTPPPPPPPPAPCSVISLGDANHVGFKFDSTIFRDPAGARATLQRLASVLKRAGESATLTGSTSSEGSDRYNTHLSLRRADAVKAMLVQLGVPASRITTFGDGSHLPGRLNDRGPNGQLLIGPAIQDRKVVAKLTGPKCPGG